MRRNINFLIIGLIFIFVSSSVTAVISTSGLRGYFTYNTNFNNYTGTSYNPTTNLYHSINSSTYKIGTASNYIYSQSNNMTWGNQNFGITGNLYTFSFWLKHQNNIDGSGHYVLTKENGGPTSGFLSIIQGGGDNFNWQHYASNGATVLSITSSGVNLSDNNWHYMTMVQNRTIAYLYIDNVERGKDTSSDRTSMNDTASFYLGRKSKGSNGNAFINGNIDDLAIYKRALTSAERTEIYNAGVGAPIIADINPCSYSGTGNFILSQNCKITTSIKIQSGYKVDTKNYELIVSSGGAII